MTICEYLERPVDFLPQRRTDFGAVCQAGVQRCRPASLDTNDGEIGELTALGGLDSCDEWLGLFLRSAPIRDAQALPFRRPMPYHSCSMFWSTSWYAVRSRSKEWSIAVSWAFSRIASASNVGSESA